MKCMYKDFCFIVLHATDGTESKDPSIVFLSIFKLALPTLPSPSNVEKLPRSMKTEMY